MSCREYDPATDLLDAAGSHATAAQRDRRRVYNNQHSGGRRRGPGPALPRGVQGGGSLRHRAQSLADSALDAAPRHGLAVGAIGNRLYAVSGDGQSAGNGIEHSAVPYNEILQMDLVLK